MSKQWKPGDKVKLASGGPEMTVQQRFEALFGRSETVECKWFDKDGNVHSECFHPDMLVPAN
jgi:uncharacterized protein YodC (DUF2158 family)